MDLRQLPFANLRHRPGRTALLVTLVALLAFTMYGAALVIVSLRTGLASLSQRLGADVIVVPQTAKSTTDLEDVVVNGIPSNFYMDRSYLARVGALSGVERVSPQYFLATVKAGCCTMPVQVIGYDPATDFTIGAWVARSTGHSPGEDEVVTGANVTGAVGSTIRLYGVDCTIVARLDETGTAFDNAVFATSDTIANLIEGSIDEGISVLAENDPTDVISAVQVKVGAGVNPADVADEVNLHVRGATAVTARSMTSGVANGMTSLSHVVGTLLAALWVVVVGVLVVAFFVLAKARTREFAVLRMMGATRSALVLVIAGETAIVAVSGAVIGVAMATLVAVAFGGALEAALGLPFLLPAPAQLAGFAVLTMAVTLVAAAMAAAVSASVLLRLDAATILREE